MGGGIGGGCLHLASLFVTTSGDQRLVANNIVTIPTHCRTWLQLIEKQMALVLVQDRFDESLVLLRRHFNWPLADVTYLPAHQYGEQHRAPTLSDRGANGCAEVREAVKGREIGRLNETARAYLNGTMVLDVMLYEKFSRLMERHVQVDQCAVRADVAKLRDLNAKLANTCGGRCKAKGDAGGSAISAHGHTPPRPRTKPCTTCDPCIQNLVTQQSDLTKVNDGDVLYKPGRCSSNLEPHHKPHIPPSAFHLPCLPRLLPSRHSSCHGSKRATQKTGEVSKECSCPSNRATFAGPSYQRLHARAQEGLGSTSRRALPWLASALAKRTTGSDDGRRAINKAPVN